MTLTNQWALQDDAASTTVVDGPGVDDGTLTNAGNTSASSVAGPGGDFPKALSFDGTDDYVLIVLDQIELGLNVTNFSIAGCYKPDDPSPSAVQCIFESGGLSNGTCVYVYNDRLYAVLTISSTAYVASLPISGSDWRAFVFTRDGADLVLYDESGASDTATATTATDGGGSDTGIARGNDTQNFNSHVGSVNAADSSFAGSIAGISLYDHTLSSTEADTFFGDAGFGVANSAPTATNVFISGATHVGKTVTGNYTFNDADSDLEGASTFRWLRNDVAISGATNKTYKLVAGDIGTDILKFEVTPVAATGTSPGATVQSAAVTVTQPPENWEAAMRSHQQNLVPSGY